MNTLRHARFLSRFLLVTLLLSGGAVHGAGEPSTASAPPSVQVLMSTSHGELTLELFPDLAPVTVENVLVYVDKGFYDGLIFHRVIPDFMIQGGGFDPDLNKRKTRAPIQNEANNGLLNGRGAIAMARTRDVHSATAQFFINLKNNTFLNHGAQGYGYAVFGRVLTGMDVVDRIAAQPTVRRGPHANLPAQPVVIRSMKRVESEAPAGDDS